jgi:bacillithiol biosynthesis deacetylase BshB1
MNLDVLAIAAHPDDVELSCGGTMIKMAQLGYRTGILDLTRGEMGTRGTPETRAKEAAAAAKVMKVKVRENLGLPDSRLEVNEDYKRKLAARIRVLRPKTVILPYWEGRHPDHYNASKLGYEACWLAGLKALPLEGGDEAFRPFKIIYSTVYQDVRPSFAVDITAQFELRKRAILSYKSQFTPPKGSKPSKVFLPLDQLENEMNLIAGYYGRMIGVKYAEPFLTREIAQVDDIVETSVRSM